MRPDLGNWLTTDWLLGLARGDSSIIIKIDWAYYFRECEENETEGRR